jgi:hypothetical protein
MRVKRQLGLPPTLGSEVSTGLNLATLEEIDVTQHSLPNGDSELCHDTSDSESVPIEERAGAVCNFARMRVQPLSPAHRLAIGACWGHSRAMPQCNHRRRGFEAHTDPHTAHKKKHTYV